MTDFVVKVISIKDVVSHPNADRLELAQIAGWQCVIQKGSYKSGDLAVYIPIDSTLPNEIEKKLFGPDSKIKLHKSRVRTIKIRGAISQGMLAPCESLGVTKEEGYDCTAELGITKFEPVTPTHLGGGNANNSKKPLKKNPHFKEYGGLDNFKHYPDLFTEGESVVITEKIHGTNFRFGWVPTAADIPMKRLKKLFGKLPKYEFVFGSNRVQLHNRVSSSSKWKIKLFAKLPLKFLRKIAYQGYYEQNGIGNVYEEAVQKYDLKNRTNVLWCMGKVFYGEIYGSSIQANYSYGCKEGERKFIGFDVMGVGEEIVGYWDICAAELAFKTLELDFVPILHSGSYSAEQAKALTKGNSVLEPTQKIREGLVIKPAVEVNCHMGRKVLKLISDDYLLKADNTDFH